MCLIIVLLMVPSCFVDVYRLIVELTLITLILGANLSIKNNEKNPIQNDAKNDGKSTEIHTYGYSSESTQRELSYEYQHYRV